MVKTVSGWDRFSLSPLILFLTLAAFLMSPGCRKSREVHQPIAYNHAIHYSEAGMDCTDCHTGVETQVRATIPSIKKCRSCHSEPKGTSETEALVVEAVNANQEIPWQRIYQVPEHVFFSHRRHVKSGKISCMVCHGEVDQLTAPPTRPLVPIAMERCMHCHDNKSISNDCITCHV
jgi:hypothetical protein